MTADHPALPIVLAQVGPPTTLTRRLVAVLPLVLGAAILAGGPRRFSGAAFVVPRLYAPWWVWGTAFALVGVCLCIASWHGPGRVFWPAWAAAVMFALWTVGLAIGVVVGVGHGQTALTGVGIYGWVTVVMAGTAARASIRPPRD